MKILFTLFTFLAFSIGANAKIITLECKIDKKISTRFLYNKTDESILSEEEANGFMELITLDTDKNTVSIEFPNNNTSKSHSATLYKNSSQYWFSWPIMSDTLRKTSIDRSNLNYIGHNYLTLLDGAKFGESKGIGKCVVAVPKKTLI